ncbi:MAG: DUF1905 domain-containing protein [Phycisphaerales bacterium]|nr:DUF1905 domain-containing protein [Phycisphaerales bacterium]
MASRRKTAGTSAKRAAATRPSHVTSRIRFTATLLRPAGKRGTWTFLKLPDAASARLPSRGQTTVEGTFNGVAIQVTLDPDGEGGHWMKVDRTLRDAAGAQVGDAVTLDVAPVPPDREPEPTVPADLRTALAAASTTAREVWADITPVARRDWIQWIVSAKRAETRGRRIDNACDMLDKGKRRPCCFDRSGMYGRNLSCPVAADDEAT